MTCFNSSTGFVERVAKCIHLLFGGPARGGGEVGVDMLPEPELDRVSCVGVEAAVRVELGVEWREDGLYCPALAKLSFR
eukprot:scaffold7454_cov53-Attheya_sp.AAC.3